MIKRIFLFLVLMLATAGCDIQSLALPASANNPPSARAMRLVTADPHALPTPTPFQPAAATARPSLQPTAVAQAASLTPSVSATSGTAQPTGIPTLGPTPSGKPAMGKYPDGQVRIMVLGSDARPGGGFRTDIIMMVSINAKYGTATVLSLPRDLWVDQPGWGTNRINTAMELGGFSLLANTLESNFGFRPNHYIMTTFTGFTSIIDSLGGVDVVASKTLSDKCKFPQGGKTGICTIAAGSTTHMTGAFALWYVRSRHSSSDFDRERRSQEVIQGLFSKLMSLNAISRIPELFKAYTANVQTDLTVGDVVSLAPAAPGLMSDLSKVRRFSVDPSDVADYVVPGSGAQVLLPNAAAIRAKVMQAVFTP
jgi:polyisoprenyl-teichoic acid--peptidoglycan teichoic acid transferase